MSATQTDFVAGIDFGGSKIALATATLDGEILNRARLDTRPRDGAGQAIQRAIEELRSLCEQTRDQGGARCTRAGVVSPGVARADSIALAPNVPGWEDLALEPLLRAELPLDHVCVANDANAAGLAEARWGALSGADPALYLSLGTGVGAAVLVGDRILEGSNGAAGEIAYTLLRREDVGFAAGQAPLEERAGGRFVVEAARRLTGSDLTGAETFASEQPAVEGLVHDALDDLAIAVANIAILLNPQRIAVGGGMMDSAATILAALGRRLRQAVPFPPQLVAARFGSDAALHGAIALALDETGRAGSRPLAAGVGEGSRV
jgi:glucokinase